MTFRSRQLLIGLAVGNLAVIVPVSATAGRVHGAGGSGGYHFVRPHATNRGTYVAPHYQTNPNGTKLDNWSTKGNVNPFMGKPGTKEPW